MNNNNSGFIPDVSLSQNQQYGLAGHTDPPTHQTSQQKRQSSVSNYIKQANKRTANPLQVPMGMQSIQNDYTYNGGKDLNQSINATVGHVSPRFNGSMMRNNMRRSIIQQQQIQSQSNQNILNNIKTPTTSAYEVPSSPSLNPMSNLSAQNQSDLSDSNNLGERINSTLGTEKEVQSNSDISIKLSLAQSSNQSHLKQDQPQGNYQSSQPRVMSNEEQQLATKLKETYKNIVNFEEIVQKNCIELTIKISQISSGSHASNSMVYSNSPLGSQALVTNGGGSSLTSIPTSTTELLNDLWTAYHHNLTLLDNYSDFLITALKPSSNQTQFKTGKNIVDLYKIPRRMWVYGIVGFLEVLKNIMTIFQEHEICLCFIAYSFNIISNLTDSALEMEGWWLEKLGDLSRMAIALYSTKFIDWKISAEYWYSMSMKTLYGHGKIYYHMCTVQQDNLEALVNISKSVSCRDPFVPTQHYLRLVVENICTQRNILSLLELPIIDFIKIHKVLLSIHNSSLSSTSESQVENIQNSQVQYGIDLVTRYSLTFGSDSNGYNFFTRELYTSSGIASISDPSHPYYMQQQQTSPINTIEKMLFWFNKGPLFAIANVNHLIGFGDPKNPFAKVFQLPEALKERKEKKDRRRKSKSLNLFEKNSLGSGIDDHVVIAGELSVTDWFYCLQYINKSVLELSMRILSHYLVGPKQASTSHLIVWLYFLISIGEAMKNFPNSKSMFLWLFRKLFPWENLINYLNVILSLSKNNEKLNNMICNYLTCKEGYLEHFNQNEFLPEVWKCWGTLWFDLISPKADFIDTESSGISDSRLFDIPISGTSPMFSLTSERNIKEQLELDNDERIARTILLARTLADTYDFGLVRDSQGFKFDEETYKNIDNISNIPERSSEIQSYLEEFLFGDGRFVQNNFLRPISIENLSSSDSRLEPDLDQLWFSVNKNNFGFDQNNLELDDNIGEENEIEGYADSEFEEDSDLESQRALKNIHDVQQHQILQNSNLLMNEVLYSDSYISMDFNPSQNRNISIEGDLGDFMDSNVSYISLDTNIWLKHCGRIFKCIRNGVFKIIIPLIVFQELRSLRKSTEITIADAATRSVIIIRELYLNKEILPIRFDGSVASDINETSEFENNTNWRTNVDETILNSVFGYDEISRKLMKGLNTRLSNLNPNPIILDAKMAKHFKYSILITDDRNMRMRAKSIGLSSFQSKWLFTQLENNFSQMCID